MNIDSINNFIKKENIKDIFEAWKLYVSCKSDRFLKERYFQAYCYFRDGGIIKRKNEFLENLKKYQYNKHEGI